MRILLVFAGQGYHQADLFSFFADNEAAINQLQQFTAETNIDLTRIDDPHSVQIIIGIYQLTLFHLLKPLICQEQMELTGYSLGEVNTI
jgi:hypothetical protein